MPETQGQQDRIGRVNERVDWAITKLRSIRRLVSKGNPIGGYHFDELREIIDSLRHNIEAVDLFRTK
jgi:hypothetical protein